MKNSGRAAIVAAFSLASGVVAASITATIDPIVSSSTPIPGGTGTFRYLSEPAVEDGQIAFVGRSESSAPGVYLWQSGGLQLVADNSTPAPGGSSNFAIFGLPIVGNGAVVFPGGLTGSSDTTGVYRFSAGDLTTVVDASATPLPGLADVLPITNVATEGNGLFVQSVSDLNGYVVRLDPGPAGKVARSGEAAPGGGIFGGFSRAGTDGTEVSFITGLGTSASTLMVSDGGTVSVIATAGTLLPNGQLESLAPRAIHSQSAGGLAFIATPVGLPQSIYIWQSGQIRLAVEGTGTPSGGGPYDVFSSVAIAEDGDLAFVTNVGLVIQSGDERLEVLTGATRIHDQRIHAIYLGPSGISNNVVTVKVLLDGEEELVLRIPYTVSQPAGGGGGGGGAADPWGIVLLMMLVGVSTRRSLRPGQLRTN